MEKRLLNIFNVNAPQSLTAKKLLWLELSAIKDQANDAPLCVVGDFNCIRNESEALNGVYVRRDSRDFNSFIEQNNLLELETKNGVFTWFGPKNKKS